MKNKILLFDLDGTLYQTHKYGVYDQLGEKIFSFISEKLSLNYDDAIKKSRYFQDKYGTSARGLNIEYNIPHEEFLEYVYDLDFSKVSQDLSLKTLLQDIPNQKIIFTNATKEYTESILERMGIMDLFDGIVDIFDTNFTSKPNESAFECLLELVPNATYMNTILVDDRWQNLHTAKKLGMGTILCRDEKHDDYDTCTDIYQTLEFIKERIND